MAHESRVPVTEADRLIDRWRAELDALYATGDTRGLRDLQAQHAMSTATLLSNGSLLAADMFAGLVSYAQFLLDGPRELRRPPSDPPTPEEDLQLGGDQ